MPPRLAGHFAMLAMAPTCLFAQHSARLDAPAEIHGVNLLFLDRTVAPTADFYRFSNGSWLDRAQIPHDQADISATAQARQRNEEMMWKLVVPTTIDYNAPAGSPEQLVGEFIRTGLNQVHADRLRFRPIEPELERIAGIQTRGDLIAEFAHLHRWGVDVAFRPYVDFDYKDSSHKIVSLFQGGLTLRDRDRYLSGDSKALSIKTRFSQCAQHMFALMGDSPESATRSAQRLLAIESRLAAMWKPEAELGGIEGNFHPCKLSALSTTAPKLDWTRYFASLGATDVVSVNAAQPEFLTAFSDLFMHVPISDWQIYLRWHLALAASPFLSSDFAQQSFELEATLTGQEQMRGRNELVLEQADACLGSELGRLLARTDYAMSSKGKVLSMVQNIRAAIREKINGLEWMAPTTKAKALEKLDRMRVDVCYPERWRDSSKLVISDDSFAQNVFRCREFEFQRRLDSMSKPVDRTDWEVRAYAVDAHYNPSLNSIVLPAGVLQAPYFDVKADDASNYGSFGTVIGHEMMHAFDGRGRRFDADGNMRNWWSKSDGLRYDEQQKAFVTQYDGYQIIDNLSVNGKLTLEENVADLGGVTAAFAAFKRSDALATGRSVDGFTPDQRFFISFGQLFRTKIRPECVRLGLDTDPHSPPQIRVKGVLQNVPEFWKAFNAVPPKTLLHIW